MSSDAKIAANRRNALKSTGPRTARGKSKSRLNAVTQGIYATTPVLLGEDEKAYRKFELWNLEHFAPVGPVENILVRQITVEQWKLGRIDRADVALGKRVLQTQADRFLRILDSKSALYAYLQLNPDIDLDDFEGSPVAADYIIATVRPGSVRKQFAQLNAADFKFINDKIDQITDVSSVILEAFVPASEPAPQESLDRQRRATMRVYLAYVDKLMELQEERRTLVSMPKLAAERGPAQISRGTLQGPSQPKRAANQNNKHARGESPKEAARDVGTESTVKNEPAA